MMYNPPPLVYTGFTTEQRQASDDRFAARKAATAAEKALGPVLGNLIKSELSDRCNEFTWLYNRKYVLDFTTEVNALLEAIKGAP